MYTTDIVKSAVKVQNCNKEIEERLDRAIKGVSIMETVSKGMKYFHYFAICLVVVTLISIVYSFLADFLETNNIMNIILMIISILFMFVCYKLVMIITKALFQGDFENKQFLESLKQKDVYVFTGNIENSHIGGHRMDVGDARSKWIKAYFLTINNIEWEVTEEDFLKFKNIGQQVKAYFVRYEIPNKEECPSILYLEII